MTPEEKYKADSVLKSYCIKHQIYNLAANSRDKEKKFEIDMLKNGCKFEEKPDWNCVINGNFRITKAQYDYITDTVKKYKESYPPSNPMDSRYESIIEDITKICTPIIRMDILDIILGSASQ